MAKNSRNQHLWGAFSLGFSKLIILAERDNKVYVPAPEFWLSPYFSPLFSPNTPVIHDEAEQISGRLLLMLPRSFHKLSREGFRFSWVVVDSVMEIGIAFP